MKKISKLIFCADIHIKTNKDHQRHKEVLAQFIEECKDIVSEYDDPEEVRIMVLGDIIDSKVDASHDLYSIVSWFFRELTNICPVIIICGNHDVNILNVSQKKHMLDVVIDSMALSNLTYLDKYFSFKSGIYVDNNIAFCLYSIFDEYKRPEIDVHKIDNNTNGELTYIGLFHGPISYSSTDSGYFISDGVSIDRFEGCDITLCGDIHKRSVLDYTGGVAIYPSSLIQVNVGENVSRHGYMTLDVETLEYEEHDIETEWGMYKFRINSLEELENFTEEFVNF